MTPEQLYRTNKVWTFTVLGESGSPASIIFRQHLYDKVALEYCAQAKSSPFSTESTANYVADQLANDLQLGAVPRPIEGWDCYQTSEADGTEVARNKAQAYRTALATTLSKTATDLKSWQEDAKWMVGTNGVHYQNPTHRGTMSDSGAPEKIIWAVGLQHLLDAVCSVCDGLSDGGSTVKPDGSSSATATLPGLNNWDDKNLQKVLLSCRDILKSANSVASTFLSAPEASLRIPVHISDLYGHDIVVNGSLEDHMERLYRDAAPLEAYQYFQESSTDENANTANTDKKGDKRRAFLGCRIKTEADSSMPQGGSAQESASGSFCAAFNKAAVQRPHLFSIDAACTS